MNKFIEPRAFADPEAAAKKLMEIASGPSFVTSNRDDAAVSNTETPTHNLPAECQLLSSRLFFGRLKQFVDVSPGVGDESDFFHADEKQAENIRLATDALHIVPLWLRLQSDTRNRLPA